MSKLLNNKITLLKNKADNIYKNSIKCLIYIDFINDNEFNYIYKVSDNVRVIDKYIINAKDINRVLSIDDLINKKYNVKPILSELNYLSDKQLRFLADN